MILTFLGVTEVVSAFSISVSSTAAIPRNACLHTPVCLKDSFREAFLKSARRQHTHYFGERKLTGGALLVAVHQALQLTARRRTLRHRRIFGARVQNVFALGRGHRLLALHNCKHKINKKNEIDKKIKQNIKKLSQKICNHLKFAFIFNSRCVKSAQKSKVSEALGT